MILAEGGWRLRQMAWSLRHSGVARLVLKSSSLTFQQILPGGWGVCRTTPRIHTAVHPLHPAATTLPSKKNSSSVAQADRALWPTRIMFLLTYVYFCTLALIKVDDLGFHRPAKTPLDCSYVVGGGEMWPLLPLHCKKSYLVNWVKSRGKTVQSIFTGEGRLKKLWDWFQASLSRPVDTPHQHQSRHAALKPFPIQNGPKAWLQTEHQTNNWIAGFFVPSSVDAAMLWIVGFCQHLHLAYMNNLIYLRLPPLPAPIFDSRCVAWLF